ncbi:MAG TPA: SH3 domain-containing protein [Roseiflexaceae bacterium]|nr:SH3 domain-containing protein [Roseiflexaceae bacterium]
MDTEEMYRRGLADAERGEPNPFYYQHYYPYRRGYDQMRRRMRSPLPVPQRRTLLRVLLAAVVIVAAIALARNGSQVLALLTPPEPTPVPTLFVPSPLPTRTPILPTATPTPTPIPTATPEPLVLKTGGAAEIVIDALRARREPTTKARVAVTFKRGARVTILEGPVEADGYVWWRIENESGSGWSAQGAQTGEAWLQPVP